MSVGGIAINTPNYKSASEPNFLGMIFEKNKFEICLNGVDPAWGGESRGLKMGS
jgi:hypothetical protein